MSFDHRKRQGQGGRDGSAGTGLAPGKRTLTSRLSSPAQGRPPDPAQAERGEAVARTGQVGPGFGGPLPPLDEIREPVPAFEAEIRGLLDENVVAGDVAAIASRKGRLAAAFRALPPDERAELLAELTGPMPAGSLAALFRLRLATATRSSLLGILREGPAAADESEASAGAAVEGPAPDGRKAGTAVVGPAKESPAPTGPARDGAGRAGKDDTWSQLLGEASTPVGKLGRVEAPRGLRLYAGPSRGETLAILPFDTLVHVERKTAHGWYYVISMGGARSESVTGQGCVEGQFVELEPPEPTAHLHYVQSGEMLKDIAAQHYKPKRGFEWGADARLYVEAIWEANKGTGKLTRSGSELSWSEKLFRSESQEKTQAIWQSVQPKKNHAIWIPSQEFVGRLEKAGAITGGSISHAAWESAKEVGEALIEFAKYTAGFVVGVLEGAYGAVRDLVMGVVDLLGMLYDLVKSLISEGLIGTAQSIGKKLVELFKKSPDLLRQGGAWLAGKWTQPDDFDRGNFHGEVVGYILVQVLIAFLTMGGSAALQASGKFATLVKVVRGLDAAGDILSYARGAAKAVKLPASALSKLAKGGGRAADALGDAGDALGDAGRRAKAGPHGAGDGAGDAARRAEGAKGPVSGPEGGKGPISSPEAGKGPAVDPADAARKAEAAAADAAKLSPRVARPPTSWVSSSRAIRTRSSRATGRWPTP